VIVWPFDFTERGRVAEFVGRRSLENHPTAIVMERAMAAKVQKFRG